MADDLPGLSGDLGAGRPLTPAQWERRELERRALEVYTRTFSYPAVRAECGLRDNEVAEKIVRAGWERYQREEDELGAQVYRKKMREELRELGGILIEMARDTTASNQLPAIDRLLKVHERMAKLDDLDKRKDEAAGGLIVQLIDARLPGERGEVFEGEEVRNELEAPEASEDL